MKTELQLMLIGTLAQMFLAASSESSLKVRNKRNALTVINSFANKLQPLLCVYYSAD